MQPLVVLSLALAAAPAFAADDPAPPLVDVIRELRGTISADRPTQVRVADPWNDENRRYYYDWSGPPSKLAAIIRGVYFFESPLPFGPLNEAVFDRFNDADTEKIVEGCKRSFPDSWDRIGCASMAVHKFFRNQKFDGLSSFCRAHVAAFNAVFNALAINRSLSKSVEASGSLTRGLGEIHTANLVIITNPTGITYSYVIDSGIFPGTLFPENTTAINFHDRDGDGHTDERDLPVISENPDYSFKPARASAD